MRWKAERPVAIFDAEDEGCVSLDWGQESQTGRGEDYRSRNIIDTMSQMKGACLPNPFVFTER